MHLGIFAKTFVRPTLGEVLDAVVQHGLDCVQFNFACAGMPTLPERIEPRLANAIRSEVQRRKITMAAVSGTFNMIHPDAEKRSDGLLRLAALIRACPHLCTSVVTLCTGTRDPDDMWRHHPDNDSPEAWRDLLISLDAVLPAAEANNVTLGFEPETAKVINSTLKGRRLLDDVKSPRLKVVMDGANLFHPDASPRMREILDEAFELLGRDIVLVHAKEVARGNHAGDLRLGSGALDWLHYLQLVHRCSFAGPLIMHGFTERDVPASAAFLRAAAELAVAAPGQSS